MLIVHFCRFPLPGEILHVDQTFDINVQNDWLNTDFAKRAIKGIDNTDHIKDGYLESPFWGSMSPQKLSTGCKNVLLMKFYPKKAVFYGTKCGDNCLPYVLEIAKEKDLEIHFQHLMKFPEDEYFDAYVVEQDIYVHTSIDLALAYIDALR